MLVNSDEIQASKKKSENLRASTYFYVDCSMPFNIQDEMKRFGNFYDFNDIIKPQDIRASQSGVSHHTPNRLQKRQELVTMVQVIFQRGRENLLFKISFAGVERKPQIEPNSRSQPRGVHPKKNVIVNELLPLIPTTRQAFWNKPPVKTCNKDLATDYEYVL
ncbi:hypothetical protein PoB_004877400 [Plakobranchus ocellatus]|uniref:Uncharacterized protein n=1 Tax=Plakobranchus ocellatus TaxID=259542 RepID=A0AAV4BTX7_9GAST|nr:hypothetical protein PoB_004877400 [Plakobranchus ocellatus]